MFEAVKKLDLDGDVLPRRSIGSYSDDGAEAVVDGSFLRFIGLEVFRDLKYRPHLLQIVDPVGDLLHSGVSLVPQLLVGVSGMFWGEGGVRRLMKSEELPAYLAQSWLFADLTVARVGVALLGASPCHYILLWATLARMV